jgi:hypothetical protein
LEDKLSQIRDRGGKTHTAKKKEKKNKEEEEEEEDLFLPLSFSHNFS